MTISQALFLGVIQGATEFLPVSSSGHLILAEHLLGLPDTPIVFDVTLHLGTLVAVLAYFRRDWVAMARSLSGSAEARATRRLAAMLIVGTIPGAFGGWMLSHYAETAFRSPWLVTATLAGVALLFLLAERFAGHMRAFPSIGFKDALVIGVSQALAIVPGVSRSGITMSAALFMGLERQAAARFSFLLSAPIIAGSGLYEGLKMLRRPWTGGLSGLDFVWGFIAAAVSGYLVIAFLMRYLVKHTFYPFIYYRLALALLVAVVLITTNIGG